MNTNLLKVDTFLKILGVVLFIFIVIIFALEILIKFSSSARCSYVMVTIRIVKINSCQEKKYEVEGKLLPLVSIAYGEGMDCLSGCVYSHVSAIVDGLMIYKIEDFSSPMLDLEIHKKFGSACSINQSNSIALQKKNNDYIWKITFYPDNTICNLEGYILINKDNNYDFSNLNSKFQQFNCDDTKIAEKVCRQSRKIQESDCSDNQNQRNSCLFFHAEAEAKIDSCNKIIQNEKLIDFCYYNLASILKDPNICDLRKLAPYYVTNYYENNYYANNCRLRAVE